MRAGSRKIARNIKYVVVDGQRGGNNQQWKNRFGIAESGEREFMGYTYRVATGE
jgi:hypothetical protein